MSTNGTGNKVEMGENEHRDARGRFTKGWRGGGRPQGSLDKALAIRELVIQHALSRTPEGKTHVQDALERLHDSDPKSYMKIVDGVLPKNLAPRAATGGLTLAALIRILDQQPARIVDARVIETPAIAAPVDELLDDDDGGDDDDGDDDDDPADGESENQ